MDLHNFKLKIPFITMLCLLGGIWLGLPAATADTTVGGTIATDTTWTAADSPYVVTSSLTVQGTDGADGVTTLTIEPGVEVRINNNLRITIGASSGDPGALAAQGTASNPIVFTTNSAFPSPGNWYFIAFVNTSDDATSIMEHCVVEYAGHRYGAIYISDASPTIHNTTVRFNWGSGIYAKGSGSTGADIACNTFTNNTNGIYLSVNPPPELHNNNFVTNTGYGIRYSSFPTLNAENNWWGDAAGPNQSGDSFSGNVDAEPWSTEENQCEGPGENHPPHTPGDPIPADDAVRVDTAGGVTLQWSGGDPDPLDTVTYDLYWGTSAATLTLTAQDIAETQSALIDLDQGITYYWQIIARDNRGMETGGPVWSFTTDGDPPDLTVSSVVTDPAGHLQSGQSVTFTAEIQNIGTGPAVDPFSVDFEMDGLSLGTVAVNEIVLSGQSVQVSQTWTYTSGNPTLVVTADSQTQISETDEDNNQFTALLFEVTDNAPPTLTGSDPSHGTHLQQVQQISATLVDSQGTVDDAAVLASFTVTNGSQQAVAGTLSESNDTFTFVPDTLPLPDDTYQVSFNAADTYGNTLNTGFTFTIDTVPPAKPVITGGTVASGTLQVRPAQNSSDQFMVALTGTREADTSVWVNGIQQVASGDAPWSTQLLLQSQSNAFEVWLTDLAGNQGESEWVDIDLQTGSAVQYHYDSSGRLQRIDNPQ